MPRRLNAEKKFDILTTREKRLLTDVITKDEPILQSISRHYKRPHQKIKKIFQEGHFRNAWIEYMEDHGIGMEKLMGKVDSLLNATKDVVRWDKHGNKLIHKAPDNVTRISAAKMLLDRAAPVEKNVNIRQQSLKINVNANVNTDDAITKLKLIEARIKELDELERGESVPDGGVRVIEEPNIHREAEAVGDEGSVHVQQGMSGIQGDEADSSRGVVQIRDNVEEQQKEETDPHAAGNVQVELHHDGHDDLGNIKESGHPSADRFGTVGEQREVLGGDQGPVSQE